MVRPRGQSSTTPSLATLEGPARTYWPWPDVEYQAYLEVRDRASRELVAVLELINPTNKCHHRYQHLRKRDQVLASTAHLVEIDLLRDGDPMPVPDRTPCDDLWSSRCHREI